MVITWKKVASLGARIKREPTGKTMLIQCSTPNTRIQDPKMI